MKKNVLGFLTMMIIGLLSAFISSKVGANMHFGIGFLGGVIAGTTCTWIQHWNEK